MTGNLSYQDFGYRPVMAAKKSAEDLALIAFIGHLITTERRKLGTPKTPLAWDQFAERMKLSKPMLMKLEKGHGGYGPATMRAFADYFFEGKLDALTGAARAYAKDHPLPVERVVVLDAVNPKEAVRQTALYAESDKRAQTMFDKRDPYTPGDATKDVEWYTERLLHWRKAARDNLLGDELEDATPIKPRRRRRG